MKRYIRTNKGHIYKWLDTDKIWFGTPNICTKETTPLFADSEEKVIAKSDNIKDLIMVGDLVFDKHGCLVYITDETWLCWCKKFLNIHKIYTKQGDNYILVWDKERGVI